MMIATCESCGIEDTAERMAFCKWDPRALDYVSKCPKCFAKENPDEVKELTRCIFCDDVMWIRAYPDKIDDVCMRCRRNRGRLTRFAKNSLDDEV